MSKTAAYYAWWNMRNRCDRKGTPNYDAYGARGIKVCARWRSFSAFLADMGEPPEGYTLERVDNDKGYSASNCRWASRKDQARNRRSTRWITLNGRTQSLAAWCEELGLVPQTVSGRIHRGMDPVEALIKPLRVWS
jgi:hypothetical protein